MEIHTSQGLVHSLYPQIQVEIVHSSYTDDELHVSGATKAS